jgi:septal ring factor EnvC (AmiA/AmiB activator)
MADMTREEVDAKLVANEARSDAQVAAILAKIDYILARMDEMQQQIRDLKASMNDLRKSVTITMISTGIAVVLGIGGINATLLSNMNASFKSGKEMGLWRGDLIRQSEDQRKLQVETLQLLRKMNQQSEETHAMLEAIKQERASGRR